MSISTIIVPTGRSSVNRRISRSILRDVVNQPAYNDSNDVIENCDQCNDTGIGFIPNPPGQEWCSKCGGAGYIIKAVAR